MNVNAELKKILSILDVYRSRLDDVSDERFIETPPGGGWSYAEVYSHIMQATLASSIAIERCTLKERQRSDKPNWLGKAVMFFGMLPPVKIKQPASVAEKMPAVKINKEEARNLIIKCRQRLVEVEEKARQAGTTSRVKHPRLGMLSAAQWLKFIRIHLAHHIKQLKRIENKF